MGSEVPVAPVRDCPMRRLVYMDPVRACLFAMAAVYTVYAVSRVVFG